MDAKEAIRSSANLSTLVLKTYVSDLEDVDLMIRPRSGCNHLAWQLGHLIWSEWQLLEQIVPGQKMDLPAGFGEAHTKETAASDDAASFFDKGTYLKLFDNVRAASQVALDDFPDPDLDLPAPKEFLDFCPKKGDLFTLIAIHPMMHAGQFVIVRRRLGKPILM